MSTQIHIPAIQYAQGGRVMYTSVIEPGALVKLVEEPRVWNPVSKAGAPAGTNRPLSKPHVQGIVAYMERTLPKSDGEFVMDGVTLYGDPEELSFVPDDAQDTSPIRTGRLGINLDAKFDIGNGQHRITAHESILLEHPDPDDPVAKSHRAVGQPVVIVADRNAFRRAQDFVTLQHNVKSLPGSLAESMDTSQPLNAFLIELCKANDIPILGEFGSRLEFDKDTVSKYSGQVMPFKTYRYATGTALIGVDQRTTAGWKKATNAAFEADPGLRDEIKQMWVEWGKIPDIGDLLDDTGNPKEIRERTFAYSGAVFYASAYALYLLRTREGLKLNDGAGRLASIDFRRPTRIPDEDNPLTKAETIFSGSLVDPATGKVTSGRPAWEAAGSELYETLR